MEKTDLLKGAIELHNRQTLRPQINHHLCHKVLDYLKNVKIVDPDLYSIRIKLLEPVFAGSLIRYDCLRDNNDPKGFFVKAMVDERMIAKGEISFPL